MEFSTQITFDSPPADVRKAILDYVASRFPKATDFIEWDSTGTRASASKMGASGTLRLSGRGPTRVEINAKIGFPASMAISETRLRRQFDEAVRDLKKKTP